MHDGSHSTASAASDDRRTTFASARRAIAIGGDFDVDHAQCVPSDRRPPIRAQRRATLQSLDRSTQAETLGSAGARVAQRLDGVLSRDSARCCSARPASASTRIPLVRAPQSAAVQRQLSSAAERYDRQRTSTQPDLRRSSSACPRSTSSARIAAVLGALDDKIDSNRRLAGCWRRRRRRCSARGSWTSSGSRSSRTASSGRSRAGWSAARVGDVLAGRGRKHTEHRGTRRFWDGRHCLGNPEGSWPGSAQRCCSTRARHITRRRATPISSRLLPARTVAAGVVAGAGRLHRDQLRRVAVNQGFIAISADRRHPQRVRAALAARAHGARSRRTPSGTTFAEISKRQFRPLTMVVPSQHALDAFETVAQPAVRPDALRLEREVATLAAIRDALLPKLVSGEIRVPDTPDPAEVIEPMVVETRSAAHDDSARLGARGDAGRAAGARRGCAAPSAGWVVYVHGPSSRPTRPAGERASWVGCRAGRAAARGGRADQPEPAAGGGDGGLCDLALTSTSPVGDRGPPRLPRAAAVWRAGLLRRPGRGRAQRARAAGRLRRAGQQRVPRRQPVDDHRRRRRTAGRTSCCSSTVCRSGRSS